MAVPLLQTKLYIPPPRPELISRPRLIERLNAGLSCKLTLISAPAGFGKTTLLSEWIKEYGVRSRKRTGATARTPDSLLPPTVDRTPSCAWLSLDAGDNDLVRFLSYLIAALQTIKPGIGQPIQGLLQSPDAHRPESEFESVLALLVNEIAGWTQGTGAHGRSVLVLDDYHAIETPGVDRALAFLLEHLPPPPGGLHLVLASRTDPTLPLSRLRARGQLAELRTADLRFTGDEIAAFFGRVVPLSPSPDDVRTLEERTEGWITGLQLAALAMQGLDRQDQVARFVQSFGGSHRYVIDYLVDEVLDQQPPEVLEWLLQTSILDRLIAPLCNAVVGREDSQALLERLDAANLFLIPLDGERRWYRYHHLFVELLRQRLHQTRPGQAPTLHRRAGIWYASHGYPLEAVQHALVGGDLEQAADRIEAAGLTLIGQGAFTTVRNWIETLPADLVRERPHLCVYHAWTSSFTHRLEAIEPFLQQAQRALPADETKARDVRGHIATLRAWNARRRRDNALAIDLLTEAADWLDDAPAGPQGTPFVRTFAALNLGLAYLDDGSLVNAAHALRKAASQGEAAGNDLAALTATSYLAAVLILQGRLHEAARLCKQTIQNQLARHGKPHPTCCLIYLRLAWVLAEWNDVDGFYAHLSQAVLLADQIRYDAVVKAGSLSMAWEKQILAEQGRMVEISDDVAEIVERVMAAERTIDAAAADVVSELESRNTAVYLADDAYFEIWPGYSEHSRARQLAEKGREQEALDLYARICQAAQQVQGIGQMIEARSSQALIHQSQGDLERALEALAEALCLSEPEGYVRTYADRGEPMAQLLSKAAARGIRPDYTAKLLAAFEGGTTIDNRRPTTGQQASLVEPLSPRELEVLRLVAQGLSNHEICERLFLALSTVKGHNRNIYGKLQVTSRTQAVARARELGLL
jgi:LuxR family maltose regulon positive regulatory protein